MTNISPKALTVANEKSRRLRELLLAPEILILPGAFNVLSALLYQHLGFPAIQGSSAGVANAMGYEDLAIGRDKTVEVSRLVAAAVTVPVNADGEDGFGGPDDVRETVRAFVAAGLAGMNMEDGSKTAPGGLVTVEQQLEKIAAFLEERKSIGSEFLLNARVDTFVALHDDPAKALAEGVRRGQAYAAAGADSVFYFRVADREAIRTLVAEVPAPVSVLAGPGVPSAQELEELGVARVSYGSMFLRVAVGAVKRAALEVLERHTHELMSDGLDGAEMKAILQSRAG
ncbi:MAG: isocitrate lyase/phosphoenolpyruvate mutase family protein [Chloroflexota bacterium]|nr:isocitrate lyase/phosphoenolpyruvate mutase family protein [Chloroflexota bacterium]